MKSPSSDRQTSLREISIDEIYSFIGDFPALLWRIEIQKARIEFLNDNTMVSPGIDGTLLMKSVSYRNSVILPEGMSLFDNFMESIKDAKSAATVFRVKNRKGELTWLKLTGTVNRKDPRYYYGFLLNVDDTISIIKGNPGMDLELELMIEDAENPMLIIHYETLRIVKANGPAKKLLAVSESDFEAFPFGKFCHDLMKQPLDAIIKALPLERSWNGKLSFQSKNGKKHLQAQTRLRYLVHNNEQLIRFSLQQTEISEQKKQIIASPDAVELGKLEKQLAPLSDIKEILSLCMESPLIKDHYDAILFSDVQIRKNIVTVYWAGDPFKRMSQASTFSYKGTIAEDINRYALDYLVVDDTQDSIKPIDWALFVPHGIRSYFAMPFYSRSVLKTVLILCATEPSCFDGKQPTEFQLLLETVNHAVRSWRRHLR